MLAKKMHNPPISGVSKSCFFLWLGVSTSEILNANGLNKKNSSTVNSDETIATL